MGLYENAWDMYLNQVHTVTRLTLEREVWPVLRHRGYRLISGNGDWVLLDRSGQTLECNPNVLRSQGCADTELLHILGLLDTPIPGLRGNCLGSLGFDFPIGSDSE